MHTCLSAESFYLTTHEEKPMTNTILTATGIDKRFSALVVLENVDFAVGTNEIIGIVEPNGAGKTTLMNALSGN